MIRYSLKCAKRHQFEGWFKSSADYDRQAKRNLVACPKCGSTRVEKAIMAPSVTTRARRGTGEAPAVPAPAAPATGGDVQRMAMRQELAEMMRKLRTEIEQNTEYVGPRFAEEARKIHYKESEARGIYGEASREDVQSLNEEGVEVYPLPVLPEDHN